MLKQSLIVAATAFAAIAAQSAPVVYTTDFISNGSRTALMDFSTLAQGSSLPSSFTQDGINIDQINGDLNGIWSTCTAGLCWFSNTTTNWYPNGGDNGWTQIGLVGGVDFVDVGADIGTGILSGAKFLQYELLKNGLDVFLGEVSLSADSDAYIGFGSGGFDTVRLRLAITTFSGGAFGNGAPQYLAIDNIETANGGTVPEPGTMSLISLALLGAAAIRRAKA